ncbi:recombinase family protein [Methylocapsa acidiphila]|uniref:recombinase family protein n=1 Tax=Methylocapsa acidiphila TaxID=133552 RepID=UPI00041BE3AA|nr:recombinase family protein [Methylocapsa acidiphila]
MKAPTPKPQRCAIYTRKSTEHNLDLAFNSLDAQREACEAYIKSQAHEGWRLSPERYDDGGLSGASLERPALQALLEHVRARNIDIIVVYKVDRLTRSLADFAKLMEIFDDHEVSFVSVTQSFNTTSSMGRLTLNVLLSFAQFEREVIGERVRDKIAASKRNGIWVGGPVPLGYRSIGKKLEVAPEDADLVHKIFTDYLRLGSIEDLAAALEAEGVKPKPRVLASARTIAAPRFMVGALAHILKNRFYIGEVAYRGEVHKGEQAPILARELFDAVQEKLAGQAVRRKMRRTQSASLLTGLIFDDRGNPMSPSHANKKGVRYRYYVSQALLQKQRAEVGSVARVSGPDIEAIVVDSVRRAIAARDVEAPDHTVNRHADAGSRDQPTIETSASTVAAASPDSDRDLIARCIARVVLRPCAIEITLNDKRDDDGDALRAEACFKQQSTDRTAKRAARSDNERSEAESYISDIEPSIGGADAERLLSIPWSPPVARRRKGVVHLPGSHDLDPRDRDVLLTAIAKARSWMNDLMDGRVQSFEELAEREQKVVRHIRFLAPLAFLSPRIVAAIANGDVPASVTVSGLVRSLPFNWAEQEQRFGLR